MRHSYKQMIILIESDPGASPQSNINEALSEP